MSEVENLLDEAEQRIGLYRDELVDVLVVLREALRLTTAICGSRRNEKPISDGDGGRLYPAQAYEAGRDALKAAEELVQ